MLQVKTTETGFELKNSQQKLNLAGEKLTLDELAVDQPGEYEANGIEIVYGESAALIVWDKLQLVYIFADQLPSAFEKAQFSPCDVVIFSQLLPKLGKNFFNETLEKYDPNVVIASVKTEIEDVAASFKSEPVETVKLTDQTLPEEGREFVVLS